MKFGLNEQTIARIQAVLARHNDVEKALIYGSRALGNFRPGSDIDLILCGKALTEVELGKIETELDDLLLPYQIDLSLLTEIDNADLVDHIARAGRYFFARN